MGFATNVIPELLQWIGIGRELVPGTLVQPVLSLPFDTGTGSNPDDVVTMIVDKSVTGDMGEDRGDIPGTAIADFPLKGDVYLDSIGHLLFNLWGDYQATGSTPTSATTVALATSAGATSVTVGAIGSIIIGSVLQFGNALIGTAPTETLVVSNVAGSVVTFATPCRFAHTAGAAIAIVVAPFTHTFSLLNSGNGQPPTHTLTYHNGLAASTQARQYGFWCASAMDLKMTSTELFQHDTKGSSVLGVIDGSSPTNTQSGNKAEPNWRFTVGIGGPATGGTQVINVTEATLNMARQLHPQFGMQGIQGPLTIPRVGMSVTGKLTFMAQDESPLIAFLANNQQIMQLVMTDGTSSLTINGQIAAYEKATITPASVLTYVVPFRFIKNTTNAGFSGGTSPMNIVLVNSVSTY